MCRLVKRHNFFFLVCLFVCQTNRSDSDTQSLFEAFSNATANIIRTDKAVTFALQTWRHALPSFRQALMEMSVILGHIPNSVIFEGIGDDGNAHIRSEALYFLIKLSVCNNILVLYATFFCRSLWFAVT